MKQAFPGYYRPNEAEYEQLWEAAVFAFDANVLLDFYRSTEETQNSFVAVLEKVKDRLWLPYQAAKEFHERKLEVVWSAQHAYGELRTAAEAAVNKFQNTLDSHRKHPRIQVDELLKIFQAARDNVIEALAANENKHPDVLHKDDIGDKLATLFDSKIGNQYTKEELEKRNKEAEARYGAQIPPGYKDHKKDSGRKYGDAILWFQLLEHAKAKQKPIIFVTGDLKDDWWYQHEGKIIGPRPELIQEMWEVSGVSFRMYRPPEFIKYAQKHLHVKSGDSLDRAVIELNEIEKEKRNEQVTSVYGIARETLGRDAAESGGSEFWFNSLPSQAEREMGLVPNPNLLKGWQSRLHEIPTVRAAIEGYNRPLVAFGPWICECRRVIAALGNYSSGFTFGGDHVFICVCGRTHSIPAPLYKAFVFEEGWRELKGGTIIS